MQARVVFSAYRCGFIQLSRPFSEVKSTTMSKRKIHDITIIKGITLDSLYLF